VKVDSSRAKEIEAYIDNHFDAEVGKWPIEIAGQKQVLKYYRFPITLLRYNVTNGRMAMEIQEWEKTAERRLDANIPEDANIVHKLLLDLDKDKTKVLMDDLRKKGQMEPGVITHDGIVINGNRRMALLQELHKEEPTGKWQSLEAVRLPTTITEKDLWKIEAGLQLSKDKVAEYHPVNELLKIKQGISAGLSRQEIAAAMYGRSADEIEEALNRLELIDSFLNLISQPGNYGYVKHFGLHEYFIDVQKYVVTPGKRKGLPKKQLALQLQYAFTLIRASVLQDKKGDRKQKGITHWDVRKLGKIYEDTHAKDAFLEHIGKANKLTDVVPSTVIEDFNNAADVLGLKEQRDQPVKLIERAISALESIDRQGAHFKGDRVKAAIAKLSKLVHDIQKELGGNSTS
jgi:hypothetical protein